MCWRNSLLPARDCEGPAEGVGHEACWERSGAATPTTSKRGERAGAEARVDRGSTEDAAGQRWATEGCGKPGRSRQVLTVRGADHCGLRRAGRSCGAAGRRPPSEAICPKTRRRRAETRLDHRHCAAGGSKQTSPSARLGALSRRAQESGLGGEKEGKADAAWDVSKAGCDGGRRQPHKDRGGSRLEPPRLPSTAWLPARMAVTFH